MYSTSLILGYFFLSVKVTVPSLDEKGLADIINNDDGLLKEAIKIGNLQEVAEIASSLSSILNFMSRQGEAGNNPNETEAVAVTKEKRGEVRTTFIVYSLYTIIFISSLQKKAGFSSNGYFMETTRLR